MTMNQNSFDFDDPQSAPQPAQGGGGSDDGSSLTLAHYAERAYLEYALSVVKGRALPDVCDGQKPVQRRILYSMERMGLSFTTASGPKAVKSARVVGDVLGRFHPHGDQAAYDALVRMAQDFSQRYPLIDGQGNFGSRDGDGAAAMRYTEARLAPITRLLLDEIDEGTVDFVPNYDGSTQEPRQLPARLPFVLLNGASGIAVGLATEVPSHNLREVAAAAVALLKNEKLSDEELFSHLPGPDYPGGGQLISSPEDIQAAYRSGRGSLKLRARWKIEDLARGQWQLVVTELPHGTSSQKVLEEIEELTNPKIKAGKKALTAEQQQLKASILAVLDGVRDESSKDAPVRLVFEPKSRTVEQQELITQLLAHTSLESSASINMTMIGADGRPTQKSLRQILTEWLGYRMATVERRTRHRLDKVLDRIHVLEGRQLVLLNIDEVIRIIRNSDEPKAALIERFKLSDRQAEDILEIRLRQLARLEAIKIEQELKSLREEQQKLQDILDNPSVLKRTVVKEIEGDAKTYGDERRTLIQEEKKAVAEIKVVDEPVTVIVSTKGWVRALKGHDIAATALQFKAGDGLLASFACRSVETLLVFGSPSGGDGRVYSVAVSSLPGGRGLTLMELEGKDLQGLGECGHAQQQVLALQFHQGQAAAALGLVLELIERIGQQAAAQREAGQLDAQHLAARHGAGRQGHLLAFQAQEGLAGLLAADEVAHLGDEAEAAGVGQHQALRAGGGPVVDDLRAALQLDQRGDGLTVAAPARQGRDGHRVHAAVAAEDDQGILSLIHI